LPAHKSIHPAEAAAIKSTVSRYRLHQHFRGVDTTYDPLDLYSGDEARMRTAISALWDLWETSKGQSNNWRVFVDGKAASPNEVSWLVSW
jgi:inositol-pentakisphosphate 2-kinase